MTNNDKKLFVKLLESFQEYDIEKEIALRASLVEKVISGIIFPSLTEQDIINEAEKMNIKKKKLGSHARALLVKKREIYAKKYGRPLANAVFDAPLKRDSTEDTDDIDNKVKMIVNLGGIDPNTGRKIPFKKSKDTIKMAKHRLLTEGELPKDPDAREYAIEENGKKKFPLYDKAHTLSAIRFFNYVSKEKESELAGKIIEKMKKFKISEDSVGETNRLRKYFK